MAKITKAVKKPSTIPKVAEKQRRKPRHVDMLDVQGAVNTTWLKNRIDQVGLTHREAAKQCGMGWSAFSNSILYNPAERGDKKNRLFKLHEIIRLARALNVGLLELLPHLGVHVPAQPAMSTLHVPVVGSVESDGRVTQIPGAVAAVSANVAPAYEALRLFGLPGLDNAVAYLGSPVPAREAVSRLCMVNYDGVKGLYFLRLGGEPDRFTLVAAFNASDRLIDVELGLVQPLIWIRL